MNAMRTPVGGTAAQGGARSSLCQAAAVPAHRQAQRSVIVSESGTHIAHSRVFLSHATRSQRGVGAFASGRGFGDGQRIQDKVQQQHQVQLAATDLIAKLIQAGDSATEVAQEHVNSLTEEFFHIGGAFLKMSEAEGDPAVTANLKSALQAAMAVKQSTLRPEIQLLNRLLAAESPAARAAVLDTAEAAEWMEMNDRYFFTLVDRMRSDVRMQPEGPQRDALAEKLESIKKDSLGRSPQPSG